MTTAIEVENLVPFIRLNPNDNVAVAGVDISAGTALDVDGGTVVIRQAIAGAADDVEFKNQVSFYAPRCTPGTGAITPAPTTAGDSQANPPGAAPTYAVQVLAVKSAAQVDEMLTRLKVMGFDAHVLRDTSGLFKVRVGHYATREEAVQAQRRLKTRLGGQPFVVEQP